MEKTFTLMSSRVDQKKTKKIFCFSGILLSFGGVLVVIVLLNDAILTICQIDSLTFNSRIFIYRGVSV